MSAPSTPDPNTDPNAPVTPNPDLGTVAPPQPPTSGLSGTFASGVPPLSGTSRLEAINTMLSIIGESPVNTLSGQAVASVKIAENTLNEVLRDIQGESWHFNTSRDVTLVRNDDGRIPLSPSTARVEVDRHANPGVEVVKRGDFLYDTKAQTYVFAKNVTKATITYFLAFEELPEAAKRYAMIRAGRMFCDRMIADPARNGFTAQDEMKARMDLREYEAKTAGYSIFDTYSVARVIDRGTVWFNGR